MAITREDLVQSGVKDIDGFVTYLLEVEEVTECSPGECQVLAGIMGISVPNTIAAVKAAGVSMRYGVRENPNRRGHSSPLNGTPRFSGENSTFTTPSGSNICGFGGAEGF